MAKALCVKCFVIEPDHNKHMWRTCNKDAIPVPGAKMNFDKCMATGGYQGLPAFGSRQAQQGEGKYYRPQKQFS